MIEPQQIPSFGPRLPLQRIEHRHAQCLKAACHGSLFASPLLLTHRQHNRPGFRHQRRVEHKDSISVAGLRLIMKDHLCSALPQQLHQRVVLMPRRLQFGPASIVPLLRVVYREGLVRLFHQHRAQRRNHTLASISSRHL